MPPGGSIDFVIHNMGLKNNACFLPLPLINGGGNWEGGMICDLILTNEIAGDTPKFCPIFFHAKKLVYTCLLVIDILYLYLLTSYRLIASNFHIVYHIILHSRPVPNYRKKCDEPIMIDNRSVGCN